MAGKEETDQLAENLAMLLKIILENLGVYEVIVITNGGDDKIVQEKLAGTVKDMIRRDGNAKILAHPEVNRRGQFLGLLDAMKSWEEQKEFGVFDRDGVSLGLMMPGKGTRLSPLTQMLGGIKPFIKMIIRLSEEAPWLNAAEASLFSWSFIAYHLKRTGFRGIAWKWGDEPQIPSADLEALPDDYLKDVDMVRFGYAINDFELEVDDYLAENKDWLLVDEEGNVIRQVRRRPKMELRKVYDAACAQYKGVRFMAHTGSPAFSYDFIDAARRAFEGVGDDKWMDVDGYLCEALTLSSKAWEDDRVLETSLALRDMIRGKKAKKGNRHEEGYFVKGEIIVPEVVADKLHYDPQRSDEMLRISKALEYLEEEGIVKRRGAQYVAVKASRRTIEGRDTMKFGEPGMHELEGQIPDVFARCHDRLVPDLESGTGRRFRVKCVDIGSNPYWGDVGSLGALRKSLHIVQEEGERANIARKLAHIDEIKPDQFGNRIVGECSYPTDGSVSNTVLIDTHIARTTRTGVHGAVLYNCIVGEAEAHKGSVAVDTTAITMTLGKGALSYNATGRRVNVPPDTVYTCVPKDPIRLVKEGLAGEERLEGFEIRVDDLETVEADVGAEVGSKAVYTRPLGANLTSFEELQRRMRQRNVPPALVERAIDIYFRQPIVDDIIKQYGEFEPVGKAAATVRSDAARGSSSGRGGQSIAEAEAKRLEGYITASAESLQGVLTCDDSPAVIRVPIELLDRIMAADPNNAIFTFLQEVNGQKSGYVQLFGMDELTAPRGIATSDYERFGLTMKPLANFSHTYQNTITLLARTLEEMERDGDGRGLSQHIRERVGRLNGDRGSQFRHTLIVPVIMPDRIGDQMILLDPAGVARQMVFGCVLLDIAKHMRVEDGGGRVADIEMVRTAVAQFNTSLGVTGSANKLTEEDVSGLLTVEDINCVRRALKNICALLPKALRVAVEEIRNIYERARIALIAA
ncbi:MAG: hypothetical protein PHY31_09450 [Smithellaceae bacterium]|nr:hypothetical protein [Smithellaceae bacterium]